MILFEGSETLLKVEDLDEFLDEDSMQEFLEDL